VRLLLDTHALVWWWLDDRKLPTAARSAIADQTNEVIVSAVSAWEIANKFRVGKWPEVGSLADGFAGKLALSRFAALPVNIDHAQLAGTLPGSHRDPFDRLIAAQCLIEAATLVSADEVLTQFGLTNLWTGTMH